MSVLGVSRLPLPDPLSALFYPALSSSVWVFGDLWLPHGAQSLGFHGRRDRKVRELSPPLWSASFQLTAQKGHRAETPGRFSSGLLQA